MKNNLNGQQPIRFDVVSINSKTGAIDWLKNAFGED
jgi:hypothetical protein